MADPESSRLLLSRSCGKVLQTRALSSLWLLLCHLSAELGQVTDEALECICQMASSGSDAESKSGSSLGSSRRYTFLPGVTLFPALRLEKQGSWKGWGQCGIPHELHNKEVISFEVSWRGAGGR